MKGMIKRIKEAFFLRHLHSYRYATAGIKHTLRTQVNIWVQIAVGLLVILAAVYGHLSRWEIGLLVLTVGAVVAAEMFNTALEEILDLIEKKHHLKVKVAKDIAAGAVLVLAFTSLLIGILILLPPLFRALFGL